MARRILPALVSLVLLSPSPALAQSGQSVAAFENHSGLLFSFGLGWGTVRSSGCEGCHPPAGVSATGSLGWFLTPRWAVMFDAFGATTVDARPEGDPANVFAGYSVASALAGVGVQYWASPRLWFKGSVGRATLAAATYFGNAEASGGGMTLGVGYELVQRGHFVLDLQGRVSTAQIQDTTLTGTGVLLGLNWR